MLRPSTPIASLFLALTIVASACGSDGDDNSSDDSSVENATTTVALDPEGSLAIDEPDATTTTAPVTGDTTTTAGPAGATAQTGVLAEGTVTTDDDITSNWSLTATTTTLCFEADLSHPDPAVADSIGDGVSACLEPVGGLDQIDGGLSVDVGPVDGEKTIGYLWGRVAPEVISLTIEHTDGSQTPIEILDGPTDVGVFAYVVEIASIPPVQDLDAVSGTQIEGSVPIRGFLRSGPTYPVVAPLPTRTTPDYPVG